MALTTETTKRGYYEQYLKREHERTRSCLQFGCDGTYYPQLLNQTILECDKCHTRLILSSFKEFTFGHKRGLQHQLELLTDQIVDVDFELKQLREKKKTLQDQRRSLKANLSAWNKLRTG